MRPLCPVQISGVGSYLPEQRLTNHDLERTLDTSDEWILQRTGISERRVLESGRATSDMAVEAIRSLCDSTSLDPSDIDLLIVASVTPDMLFPSTACLVQSKLGIPSTWGFDLSAACCGFVYALSTGVAFVSSGMRRKVVVVGADAMSRIIDPKERNTCVLFGEGAGAILIEPAVQPENCFIDAFHEIDGSGGDSLCMPAGGSLQPANAKTVKDRLHFVKQDGSTVFKFATRKMEEASRRILERNKIAPSELKLMIPHQANARIIRGTAERLNLRNDQVVLNLGNYGNTTAATIPLAMQDALLEARLQKGDIILLASVGAGFTVGTTLLRWAY